MSTDLATTDPYARIRRRHFVAIATADYDDPNWDALPGVVDDVADLRGWLCTEALNGRRFTPVYGELAANPMLDQIEDALRNPPPDDRWRDSDAVFLFITGHAEVNDEPAHYLILKGTEYGRMAATAQPTAQILRWLLATRIENIFVIVDTCYAGNLVRTNVNLPAEKHWVVLLSTGPDQRAGQGALTEAVLKFLAELNTPTGRQYGGADGYLDINVFSQAVQANLGRSQSLHFLPYSRKDGDHVCLPTPHPQISTMVGTEPAREDLALTRIDLETHWSPRARGVSVALSDAWLFTGRVNLMRELIATAAGPPGATVITGVAGSGKSAVLARLVTLSDPRFRAEHAADIADIPEDLLPGERAVDVAVVATGKLDVAILDQISSALGVPPAGASSLQGRLDAWRAWLSARPDQPITIVVDALDEATNPISVLELLAALEPDWARPRLRLLIGVRSPGGDGAADGPVPGLVPLAESTIGRLHARRISVDEPPWWQESDVTEYVAGILRNTPRSPYREHDHSEWHRLATVLGARSGRSFLIAGMVAGRLADQPAMVDPDDPSWLEALRRGVVGVFQKDLHATEHEVANRLRVVTLLRAVAFSRGAGLPWRQVWPRVATAIGEESDGRVYGDEDIVWLLNSRHSGYLTTSYEDGAPVYRLSHQLIRTTLRYHWRDLLEPPPAPTGNARSRRAEHDGRA